MSNTPQNKRMTSLPVNESFIEKSIIANLPESPLERENMSQMQTQISRLTQELHFYKKQAFSKTKNQPFSFRDIEKSSNIKIEQSSSNQANNEMESLRQENEEQKLIIKKISEQLRSKKKSEYGIDLTAECQRLEYLNKKLQIQNQQLKKELLDARQVQKEQERSIRKSQLEKQKSHIQSSGEMSKSNQIDQLKRKNMDQQLKIEELAETALQYVREIDALNLEIQKLRRQNVIDRTTRKSTELRTFDKNAQNSRYSIINMHNSRAMSQLDLIDTERFNLKLSEKNKEYQQLYLKFQSLQNQFHALQQINNDLERQRKFLAERLSDIEIHTEGDEVVGELENKLVLMSTELMRLGNLSRTKTQQNKQLNIRLKELILKRENLEKDIIERDKLILNYKEQLRIIQIRNNDRTVHESRIEKDSQIKQKNNKLAKEVERLSILIKQKSEALKNSDIKNAILEQKNIRLQKQNQELQKQNKELNTNRDRNKSIHTKVLNLQAQVNYFKEANLGLKDQMKRYESKFYQNRSDIEKLTRQKEQTRQNNLELQDKIRNTQEDLRRVQVQLDDKTMELREINHKTEQKVILKTNQIKKLEEKIIIMEKQVQRSNISKSNLPKYQELIKEIQRLQGIQLSLKLQLNTYEEKLALLAQENQRLTLMANNIQHEKTIHDKAKYQNEQKDRKIRDLQKEVQTTSARQKRYKDQNQNLREKLRETFIQERQTQSLQFKNRQLRDEIDGLKTQIYVKDQEIKNVNERYRKESSEKYTLLLRNQELNSKLGNKVQNYASDSVKDYYEMEIKRLNSQIRLKNEKLQKLQQQVNNNDDIYSTLSGQVQRLNIVLEQRARQVMNYKKEIDFLQHKVRTCEQSLRQRNVNQISSEKSIVEAQSKTKIEICEGKIRNYEGQIDLVKQRYENLKRDYNSQQNKLSQTLNDKYLIQQKLNELEYQLTQKSNTFKHVEESFKLTIAEIKKSNQRLEQTMRQIENHYTSKLEQKERQYENVSNEKRSLETKFSELERKYSSIELTYGSEIKEKNLYINNLSNNHNQTKEEIAQIKRIKNQYQVKISLLSQEIERLTQVKDKQKGEIERLLQEIDMFSHQIKDSSATNQTIDVLSSEIQRLNYVLVQNVDKIRQLTKKCSRLQVQNSQTAKDLQRTQQENSQYEKYVSQQKQNYISRIQKVEELNKELKYQLQEKTKDADRFLQRLQMLEKKNQTETNQYMKNLAEEIKLQREGNQKLENKLSLITRQYQQLVTQLEYYKRPKSNEGDEKMRIIGSYEATIKHMKEQNSKLTSQKSKLQTEYDRLNKLSHQLQERSKISEEKARVFEDKCKRLDQRCRVLDQRLRNADQILKSSSHEKLQIQQKTLSALEEVGRLQTVIKSKQSEIQRLQILLSNIKSGRNQDYNPSQNMKEQKGIFVIKQVSEFDERSRSASGNGMQPTIRHPVNPQSLDLQHRYQLLETVNKKLSSECECLRKKNVQFEFKMGKLKEQFDLINRLIHQYREENDKLKQTNKMLNQGQQRGHFLSSHSQFSSPQHSSIKPSSYIDSNYRTNFSPPQRPIQSNLREREDNLIARSKLIEQIDRLNKVNSSLQNEIHDLRLNSTENISLRKRFEQNLALMVILFTEVQSLRMRVKDSDRLNVISPKKL